MASTDTARLSLQAPPPAGDRDSNDQSLPDRALYSQIMGQTPRRLNTPIIEKIMAGLAQVPSESNIQHPKAAILIL